MGSRIAVMSRGRIEQVGTPQDVYDRPASVFIAQFVGTPPMNILPAGSLEPGEHLVGVRPEHLRITPGGPISMTVTLVEQLGHEQLITGLIGDSRAVVREAAHAAPPAVGSIVHLDADVSMRHRFSSLTEQRIDV